MARVFGSAKIVFNESVLGDLNFRTFEAMACGALLLTERIGNGLDELFTPGVHLATYGPDDLIAQATHYLAHDAEREAVARNGREAVAAHHTMAARMAAVTDWLAAGVRRRETATAAGAAFGVAAQLTVVRGLSDPSATLRLAAEHLQAAALAGDPDAALALADVMITTGRDDGALQLLRFARERRPADPRAWFLAAEVERRRGGHDEAAELFRGGIAAAPVPSALRDEAVAALAVPDGAAAWFAIGRVLQAVGLVMVPGFVRHNDAGLPATAMDYFRRSIERAPSALAILEHVARVLELAGRDEYARSHRERQVQAAPTDAGVRRRFARCLGRAYASAESAHHARVAAILADDPPTGSPAELAAAWREAGEAWLRVGAAARGARAVARAFALESRPPAPTSDPDPAAVVG
jgi:tetratricopeptide (TPR) repeat protein